MTTTSAIDAATPLSGRLYIFVAFDWGDEIDLERARQLAPSAEVELVRRSRTPTSIAYKPPPLRFHLTVESRTGRNCISRELAHFRAPLGFSLDENGQYRIAYNYDQRADGCSILSAQPSLSVHVQFRLVVWNSFERSRTLQTVRILRNPFLMLILASLSVHAVLNFVK